MTLPNPVNDLIPHIQTAMEEWFQEQEPRRVKAKVREQLDKSSREILMKLLGFDHSYGSSWKIDHCNGRADSSLAGTTLRELYRYAVKEWLTDVGLPQLSPAETKKLQSALHKEYVTAMHRELRAMVRTRAKEDLDALMELALPKPAIDQYLATQALITDH